MASPSPVRIGPSSTTAATEAAPAEVDPQPPQTPIFTTVDMTTFPPLVSQAPAFASPASVATGASPIYIPPLASTTAPTVPSPPAPTATGATDATTQQAQGASDLSLGSQVQSLTAELTSLKSMMAELLQRQLAADSPSTTTRSQHVPPALPTTALPTTSIPSYPSYPYNPVMPGPSAASSFPSLYNPYSRQPPVPATPSSYLPPYYPQPSTTGPTPYIPTITTSPPYQQPYHPQPSIPGPTPYTPTPTFTFNQPAPITATSPPHVEPAIPSPRTRSAAIVDELLGETNQSSAFEARLDAKIALM